MKAFLELANANSGGLTVMFSAVVTLATVVYAILTWRLVLETSAMRRAQTDAFVVAMLVPSENAFGFLDLLVRNDGMGPAYDVAFSVIKGSSDQLATDVSEFGFVKRGLPYFAAHQEFRSFLASIHPPESVNWNVTLKVRYRTASEDLREHVYPLDFGLLEKTSRLGLPFNETAGRNLEKLTNAVERIQRLLENRDT